MAITLERIGLGFYKALKDGAETGVVVGLEEPLLHNNRVERYEAWLEDGGDRVLASGAIGQVRKQLEAIL